MVWVAAHIGPVATEVFLVAVLDVVVAVLVGIAIYLDLADRGEDGAILGGLVLGLLFLLGFIPGVIALGIYLYYRSRGEPFLPWNEPDSEESG